MLLSPIAPRSPVGPSVVAASRISVDAPATQNRRNVFHFDGGRFEHADACRLSNRILRSFGHRCRATAQESSPANTVVIDLSRATDASTAAFAHLVLLRGTLLRQSRDLHLAGLNDRAAKVYEVNRLNEVLPRAEDHSP